MMATFSAEFADFRRQAEQTIQTLTDKLDRLNVHRPGHNFRHHSRKRSLSLYARTTWRWYHHRFGRRAHKCVKLYSFISQSRENIQAGV